MDSQTQLGLELLAAALLLGLLGDALLHTPAWGVNAALWTGALALTTYGLLHRWDRSRVRRFGGFFGVLGALAVLFVLRDAALLKLAAGVAVLAVLASGVRRLEHARSDLPEAAEPHGLLVAGTRALLCWPRFLIRGIEWGSVRTAERSQAAAAVGRGMALAVPVLAGFGTLLVAADAGFERLVYGVFAIDPLGIPGHVLWLVGLGWLAGGFLYGVLVLRRAHPEAAVLRGVRLGIVEAGVVIGSLNLLLGVFVVVQLPYLFGGHGVVLATEGLTLASYARRGFFELAGVAALALPLLLGLRRLLASERGHALRWYNALACAQVGLLVLVLASAAQRMLLYQEVYGLTTLRLYVSACIGWLAVVLLWFAATVLCGRVGRFVPGAVAAGLVLVGSLYALNPDALIVRVNAARAAEGHPFDLAYATGRSADAVPALLDVLDALPPAARAEVAAGLLRRWHEAEPPSWRTWNRSRLLARRAVAAEADRLFALVGARPGAQEASMHVAAGVDVDGGAGGMVGEAAGEQDH